MLHLVFIACLTTTPDRCDERRTISYLEPISPMSCALRAQPELARWNQRHPNYVIQRWHCASDVKIKA
jgi:hypothetical protein